MGAISAIFADELISAAASFEVSDWSASAGFYILDIQHNLDSQNINTSIWENNNELTFVNRVSIINNNTIRLYVTLDSDCRFAGKIILFKTQEQ